MAGLMDSNIAALVLYYLAYARLEIFNPVLDCSNKPGCPYESPFLVTSLKNVFGEIEFICIPKMVLCAFLCQTNEECVSFNQMPDDECHMFRSFQYKIIEDSGCKFYEVGEFITFNGCDLL